MATSFANLYFVLAKIMKRCDLNQDTLPPDLNQWHQFIERINNYFLDAEQERYLLERSMEISSRELQELNANIEKTRSSMLALARQAGMSEIATSILHNIGNVLNSINLSVSLIDESIQHVKIENLKKISQMINDNQSNSNFLLTDPKGKLIPIYLKEFSEELKNDSQKIQKEIANLNKNLEHVKSIVLMQNNISGVSGLIEKLYLPEVIDLSIKMAVDMGKYNIEMIKNYEYSGFIYIDKAKLLQILINLIRNAKEAIAEKKGNQKNTIAISTIKLNDFIEITVKDNGIGIEKNNLTKIFSMGFTTKPKGHGFGLHSSALMAKELGGSLQVKSEGKQKGSTFILTFPERSEKI